MKKIDYVKKSFVNAFGALVYILLVAWFMSSVEHTFDNSPSFLIPLVMLLLFVVSACIVGYLVLGRSIYLYLDGFKKEATYMLFSVIGWLILFIVVVVVFLIAR